MSRSCGAVQNFFRQVDLYPALRRNQVMLESLTTTAAARQGVAVERVFPRRIQVVVHVLYREAADNISDDQITSQIEVLNEDFSAKNNNLKKIPEPFKEFIGNPGLEFFLAEVDPSGASMNGITRRQTSVHAFSVDDGMKADASSGKNPWDPTRYLNMWVCRLSGGVLVMLSSPAAHRKPMES